MKIEMGTKASRTVWIKRERGDEWEQIDQGEMLPKDVAVLRIFEPEDWSK